MAFCVVTALYDLKSIEQNPHRKSIDMYLEMGTLTLSQQNVIVFTEAKLSAAIQKLAPNATVCTVNFDNLPYAQHLTRITSNQKINPFHNDPAKLTPTYMVIQWSKFWFVKEAIRLLPNFTAYVWMDFGLGSVVAPMAHNPVLETLSWPDDLFSCTVLNPVTKAEFADRHTYYSTWQWRTAGGLWSVGRKIWPTWWQYMNMEVHQLLEDGFVGCDEEVLARFCYEHPDLCDFYFSDYSSLLINRQDGGTLKEGLHSVEYAIHKANANGLNHIAAAGYRQKIKNTLDPNDRFLLYCHLYIHTFYFNPVDARNIATYMLLAPVFKELIHQHHDYLQHIFSFVSIPLPDNLNIDNSHIDLAIVALE